ncbi:T9SS type A sorting domain-containing protein [Taibaiella koreensis]|uniref:T9SS type A sorting domain-containing protein n=1 Tax=Taibaiella koreensis TaxID=1268548 RepID=UPI000E59CB70|nr:T9SS type A sorting domain-containing protein [Taibaiella koreensis]
MKKTNTFSFKKIKRASFLMGSKVILLWLCLAMGKMTLSAQPWGPLGTGANALNANGSITDILAIAENDVYVAGDFKNSAGKRYVAHWNGIQWSELGTGVNTLNANYFIGELARDQQGNIYAAGGFTNSSGKYYVAKWDGTTWKELGSGATALNATDEIQALTTDASGNVYAAGFFFNSSGRPYVAKWDGTTWAELGTGPNRLNANGYIHDLMSDAAGNIYTVGNFQNSAGKKYVAKWNGTTWSAVGTGANGLNADAQSHKLCQDASGNLYTGGQFENELGKVYVAKWDGVSWAEARNGADRMYVNDHGVILGLAVDGHNNVYAAGTFENSNGKPYVARWSGTAWIELGAGARALNPNSWITSVTCAGSAVFAVGNFTDSTGKFYVARYMYKSAADQVSGEKGVAPVTQSDALFQVYPNPATDKVIIRYGQDHPALLIEVKDINGRVLSSQKVKANDLENGHTVSLETLQPGIYMIGISGTGVRFTQKIVRK